MEKIDILEKIHKGEISKQESYDVYDKLIDHDNSRIAELLCLSKLEMTAFCNGVPLYIIARFRYEGWPNVCSRCGKKIDVEKYGWSMDKCGSGYVIRHLRCPK